MSLIKPAPEDWRVLRLGMVGHDVAAFQAILRLEPLPAGWTARWPVTVDGVFGDGTEKATKAYQAARGLTADGAVGPRTRATVSPVLFAIPASPVAPDASGLPPIKFIQARDYGHANRTMIDLIVLHSAEVGEFHSSAEAVAAYFKAPIKPSSAGYVVDDDSIVQCVLDKDISFHAPGANTRGIGIEQAGYAKQTRDEWLDSYGQRMLRLVARLVAAKAKQYSVPLVWLSEQELIAGKRGLCTHVDVSRAFKKSNHVDCGVAYPKDIVLQWALEAAA